MSARGHRDDHSTAAKRRPSTVDEAVQAQLDFLEGSGDWPDLSELTETDRREAAELINLMQTGRGLSSHISTPSLHQLLAGTEFESALGRNASGEDELHSAEATVGRGLEERRHRAERICDALRGVDARVSLRVEPHPLLGPGVRVNYLDLRAVFVAATLDVLSAAPQIRDQIAGVFDADADLDYIAVVADTTEDMTTQLLGPSDVSTGRINAPNDQLAETWAAPLPIDLALKRMMQYAAPEWGDFTFSSTLVEPVDLARILAEHAARVLQREARRPYRGDKGLAYKSFADASQVFTEHLTRLAASPEPGSDDDTVTAVDELTRDAA